MPEVVRKAPDPRRWGGRSTGRRQAQLAVPRWPGTGDVQAGLAARENAVWIGGGSLSYIHAQRVWHEMREATAQRGGSYRAGARAAGVLGRPDAGGMAQLGFLSLISQHLRVCKRCWTTGQGTDRPVDWITWAVAKCDPGMRDAFGAIWRDAGGEGLPTVAPRGVPRG